MKKKHSILKPEILLFRWYIFISCVAILISIIPVFEGFNMNIIEKETPKITMEDSNGDDRVLIGLPLLYSMYKARAEKISLPFYMANNYKNCNIILQDSE